MKGRCLMTNQLLSVVQSRAAQATGMTTEELHKLVNADKSVLHDPFLYTDMETLIDQLHTYAMHQQTNPSSLLVIDTDYDTDGIMSASVLSAALDVFNINYRIYIPSMANGYGLSPKAVDDIMKQYNNHGYSVDMILTADNGTNAVDGVNAAKDKGMHVLVTDHHLGGQDYADADVIVNPNRTLPDGNPDAYPFKGNAGAAVAWKTMMAYATKYEPQNLSLIEDLIVFAGIANVSDVMPIVDENHYMVKEAVGEIQRLIAMRERDDDAHNIYHEVKSTPFVHYNTVFHGLYDILTLLQKSKDDKRAERGKKPIALTENEELIGWYLSPMFNAPRRIHATSQEGMMAMMSPNPFQRRENIEAMIEMNTEKTELRNRVVDQLDWEDLAQHDGNVLFVNAQHGISGLVAGQITSVTNHASIVFAMATDSDDIIYDAHQFDDRFNKDDLIIAASARSTSAQPLDVIMARINEMRPDIIVGGGGHAQAAGYSIKYSKLEDFALLFNAVSKQVQDEVAAEYEKAVAAGEIQPVFQNVIRLTTLPGAKAVTPEYTEYSITSNRDTLKDDMESVYDYEETLRPFGKDFDAQTQFELVINVDEITKPVYDLNLNFWQGKTLKFSMYGVDVLTFDEDLARNIKQQIANKVADNPSKDLVVHAKLVMNEFRGMVTPQLQLTK